MNVARNICLLGRLGIGIAVGISPVFSPVLAFAAEPKERPGEPAPALP